MEASADTGKAIHPLAWVAGIAVIVFSAVGVGAMMGWIPSSIGGANDAAVLESKAAADSAPKAAARSAPATPSAPSAPAAKAARPMQQAAPAPQQVANQETRSVAPQAGITCAECGVIESVREIEAKGSGSGLGVVGGAVVGGLLGSQVGGGKGQDVMTVVGAVGGGFAGNEVEKRVKSTKSYSTTVRLDDGTSRVFSDAAAPGWRVGEKVRIVNGVIRPNA